MAPDPNAYCGSYTGLAMDCKHVIHYSVPSALSIKLSRPTDTYGPALNWEDEYPPEDFVCVSANTLLCPVCEKTMRAELTAASEACDALWAFGFRSKETSKRYVEAAIKVANFEGRMASRGNSISQDEALKRKEREWEAAKKVRFDVEAGMGAGEKVVKKKKKKRVIILGPPSTLELPLRVKKDEDA